MAEFFLMPQASPTMEAGKVLEWHKSEGDALAPQDVIAEVETDKAAMEVEVFDPGYLLKIIVPAGTEAKVDQPIAIIGQSADEDYADLLTQLGDAAPAAPPAEAPAPAPEPAPAPAAVEEEVVTDAAYFLMPQASPTMEAGKILAWHKSEGDALAPQDVIAEVETDKAAMEVEVFDPGYLLKILVPADVEAKVDQPIAIIGPRPDSDISGLVRKFEQGSAGGAPSASPTPAPTATAPTPTPTASAPAANAPAPAAQPARTVAPAPGQSGLEHYTWQGADLNPALMEIPTSFFMPVARKRAAPAARQAAARLNVDLSLVDGTGPHGRVMTEDVKRFAENRNRPAPAARPALPAAPTAAEPEVIPHNNMRKTIARRMKQVYLDAPTFFLTVVFDCDNLVRFRGQMKAAGVKVSYNDILVKAVGRALQDVPAVNASWGDDAITRHGEINIGIAVALDGGLIVPVIRDVDRKGLAQISAETREMAGRARELKLKPHEYQGSTFTISNLGMMGIEHFTAIINQPNSAILAVGGLQQEPVVVDGALSVGWRMRVTMTCDHRVIDGALGAAFLKAVRRYIENPALLAA